MLTHPSQRFRAPGSIMQGTPLKELLGPDLIRLIAESFAMVHSGFRRRVFEREAADGLDELEFNQRGKHIGMVLARHLTGPFSEMGQVLTAAMGPELTATEGNGLAPFFYVPHASVIAELGVEDFAAGMQANYELTKRFTAEFSIRPFLVRHQAESLQLLQTWVNDPNPHVRRLVSEGTRPRLPWAMRLKEFQTNPSLALPLLEQLKDDPVLYVRRSVANHLADLLKDHPETIYKVCESWLREVSRPKFDANVARERKWMIRHAVRLPAKKGDPHAIELRLRAK